LALIATGIAPAEAILFMKGQLGASWADVLRVVPEAVPVGDPQALVAALGGLAEAAIQARETKAFRDAAVALALDAGLPPLSMVLGCATARGVDRNGKHLSRTAEAAARALHLPLPRGWTAGTGGGLGIACYPGTWDGLEPEPLPKGLVVPDDLYCNDHPGLRSLPEGLVVLGHATLRGCALAALPDRWAIHAGLTVQDAPTVRRLGGLAILPGGPTGANQTILICRCEALEHLWDGPLDLPGNLSLVDCPNLRTLPAGLRIAGDLSVERCGLTALPDDLLVEGRVLLRDCPNLTALPAGLVNAKGMQLDRCPITTWPNPPRFMGHLHLGQGMAELPEGLAAKTLGFAGSDLRSLPRGLDVEGLSVPPEWSIGVWDGKIPPDAKVSGHVGSSRSSLTLAEWRKIHE
jgi:hypothetical protein